MKELQTILGTDIPLSTRGIVYLCIFNYEELTLKVVREILCDCSFDALNLHANIPNPESQVAMGETFDKLIINLHRLHKNMEDPVWLRELAEQL